MAELCVETPEDYWQVEALLDLCFAPGREALSSYRLREGVAPVVELCLLWRDEGGVVAAIRHWPVRVVGKEALLLGPIAVHPTHQGEGLGGFLIREAIQRAKAQGWKRTILVGDPSYYRRFGFEKLKHVTMPPPTNPDRVLGLALQESAWSGLRGAVMAARD